MDFGQKVTKTRFLARAEIAMHFVGKSFCYRIFSFGAKKSAFPVRVKFSVFFKKWVIFGPLFCQKWGNTAAMGRYPLGQVENPFFDEIRLNVR